MAKGPSKVDAIHEKHVAAIRRSISSTALLRAATDVLKAINGCYRDTTPEILERLDAVVDDIEKLANDLRAASEETP